MSGICSITVLRHCVPRNPDGLSPLQERILNDPAPIRIFSAPTGAGKSYALIKAAARGKKVLFIVPTRRLAQNLIDSAGETLIQNGVVSRDEVMNLIALWSSDETARQKESDPTVRIGRIRIRQVRGQGSDHRFIVATPESLAFMLLQALQPGHGATPFNLADPVGQFDHIVFDEFHTIDARGFGLCAAVAIVCARSVNGAKVTFLSATPIEIAPVLIALGLDSSKIATGAEEVITTPSSSRGDERALHGDVRITFEISDDMVAVLERHQAELRACLARERQVVMIYDSLEALLLSKDRLAAFFDRLGVPASARLAVNSVDDHTRGSFDGQFVSDRDADPLRFQVLLATSSVEMGVTFRAGLIAMDPGHDALSFVQRVGRVARGDESGSVLVRLNDRYSEANPWLREMLSSFQEEANADALTIDRFLEVVLKATRERFRSKPGDLASDEVPSTFQSMPMRAVWAAALFWHALEEAQFGKGQRDTLHAFRPNKVGLIAAKLRTVTKPIIAREGTGAQWAKAFLAQAATLRNFTATVIVVEPDGSRRGAVPLRLLESRSAFARAPLVPDDTGQFCLHIDGRLERILQSTEKVFREERCNVLLPNSDVVSVSLKDAAGETARILARMVRKETNRQKRERYEAARTLVLLSGLVPASRDAEAGPCAASVIL